MFALDVLNYLGFQINLNETQFEIQINLNETQFETLCESIYYFCSYCEFKI